MSMSSFHSFPQANVTGRNAKTVREYLEKHYSPEAVKTRDDTIVLAIKALLEVVQSGSKSMEVAVMERGKPLEVGMQSESRQGSESHCHSLVHVLSFLSQTRLMAMYSR